MTPESRAAQAMAMWTTREEPRLESLIVEAIRQAETEASAKGRAEERAACLGCVKEARMGLLSGISTFEALVAAEAAIRARKS